MHCRQWALEHWEENTHVNLFADLSQLKAMCRERQRIAEEEALKVEQEV